MTRAITSSPRDRVNFGFKRSRSAAVWVSVSSMPSSAIRWASFGARSAWNRTSSSTSVRTRARPRSTRVWSTSFRTTGTPLYASSSAIAAPMVPAPTTATLLTLTALPRGATVPPIHNAERAKV